MRLFLALVLLLGVLARAEDALGRAVFSEANRAREARGLSALAWDERLYRAARAHALDMLRRGYFGHQAPGGPEPKERYFRVGVYALKAAENLYELDGPYLPADFARRAVAGWLKSPGHRRNLLDPGFDKMAVAVVAKGRRYLAVQEFAYDPWNLAVRLEEARVPVRFAELEGVARRPLALLLAGVPLAEFGPGPVSGRWVLPAGSRPVLVYKNGSSYFEARCPADCRRLGVALTLKAGTLPGLKVSLWLPSGRYRLAFGEPPVPLKALSGPATVLAPYVWRELWLGRGETLVYRIPLRP